MNTGVFASKYNFDINVRPLLYTSPHLPNVRMHTNVSLFRRKFWASNVMYRGSATNVLALQGFCVNLGISPQIPQKGDYTHLVDFLRLRAVLNENDNYEIPYKFTNFPLPWVYIEA